MLECSAPMFAEERQRWIAARVHVSGACLIAELARHLRLSTFTIRQDLLALEAQGLLRRIRGGAVALPERRAPVGDGPWPEASLRVAEAAARLVPDGSALALDAGPSTRALALALRRCARNLTVVTNALDVASLLEDAPAITTHVTGGTLLAGQHALVSPYLEPILSSLNVALVFVGASGVDVAGGLTATSAPEAEVKRQLLLAGRRRVVLADSGALGHVAAARFAGTRELDAIVTDRGADLAQVEALRASGLEIHLA